MKNVRELNLRKLENQVEENNEEVVEEAKEQIGEGEFMQMIMEEINSKTLTIHGEFNDEMVAHVKEFANKLWYYEADASRPLYIDITSHGGRLDSLFAILDTLEYLKEEWDCTIITRCKGFAESCGFVLWCYGDNREMGTFGELMCHKLAYQWSGNVDDHDKELQRAKKLQDKLDKMICKKTGLTKKQLNAWYRKDRDKFITYEEAMKLGILTVYEEEKENEDK